MTWWLSGRGCLGANAGGFDPYAPPSCGPFIWEVPRPSFPAAPPPPVGHADKSCCGSCSEGGVCETSCKDKKPEQIVGALYVSDAELDALGSEVALMGADVDAGADKEHLSDAWDAASAGMKLCHAAKLTWDRDAKKCVQKEDPTYSSYIGLDVNEAPAIPLTRYRNERWTPFQIKWNAYRGQTIHEPTVYDQLRTEFSTLRDEWTGPLGQTTRSSVPPSLKETSGGNAIPWGWIALGVGVVAVPFILPSLAGIYFLATRGRGLGLNLR